MYNFLAKLIFEGLHPESKRYRLKRRERDYYLGNAKISNDFSSKNPDIQKADSAAAEIFQARKNIPKNADREKFRQNKPHSVETAKWIARSSARAKIRSKKNREAGLHEANGRTIERKQKSGEKTYKPTERTQSLDFDIENERLSGTRWKANQVRKAVRKRLASQNADGKGTKARKRKTAILKRG
jgi:hypothetical protein